MKKNKYIVFDSTFGAVELEEKLNELADRGYLLHSIYAPIENSWPPRLIMEHKNARRDQSY